MFKRIAFIILCLLAFSEVAAAYGDTTVREYVKRDGTYVRRHHRTKPDDTMWNNYSSKGNTNPWTGQRGWITPIGRKPRNWRPNHFFSPY